MADELRKQTETDWALALSGISGPTGGSPEKPVGTVHIAIAGPERKTIHRRIQLEPKTRAEYKTLATAWALALLLKEIEQAS
jgi:nicotinamide-nucleotide amidase